MKLTLAEKLGLIYTSAGSNRKVAALVGISHQRVGRLLAGTLTENSRTITPDVVRAIDVALAIHTDVARDQARAHKLPFSQALPVYYAKHPKGPNTDELGMRAAALHADKLSDRVRSAWIQSLHRTRKFVDVSVGSIINLELYNRQAKVRYGNTSTGPEQRAAKRHFQLLAKLQPTGRVFTMRQSLQQFSPEDAAANVEQQLREKHQPATGVERTRYAAEIYVQVKTTKGTTNNAASTQPRAKGKNRR